MKNPQILIIMNYLRINYQLLRVDMVNQLQLVVVVEINKNKILNL